MKRVRKVLYVILAVLIVFASGLGGCKKEKEDSNVTEDTTQKIQTVQQDQKDQKDQLPEVNLIYYYYGFVGADDAEVFAKANETIKKEINATVDFRPLTAADYNKKMTLMITTGEEMDLSQSGGARQPYASNILKGAYLELDSLLDEHGEWFKENIPENIFDALRFKGKIYAVPNYQINYTQRGLAFQTEILEKHNIDVSNIKTPGDYLAVLEKVKAAEGDNMVMAITMPHLTDYFVFNNSEYYEVPISSGSNDYHFPVYISNDLKVVDALKLPKVMEAYKMAREFKTKGFFASDSLTNPNLLGVKKTGKAFSAIVGAVKPGGQPTEEATFGGKKLTIIPVSNERMNTTFSQATLTCINKVSKNPERAMMLLNLLNGNKALNNTMFFGIEDKHYKKVAENRIELIGKPAYESYQWCIGNQFNAYLLPGQEENVWEETKEKNMKAQPVGAFGFMFDSDSVKTEIANVNNVVATYGKILIFGEAEDIDKTVAEYSKKCYEAGMQKIIDEMQKQLDAWKANM